MRLFLALNLAPEVARGIDRAVAPLCGAGLPVRWVGPENLHLTLKFLGEVAPERAGAVEVAARRAAADVPPFDLRLGGIGAFPNLRRPRVVWLGVERSAVLERLQAGLEAELGREGFPREDRPFSPHLTLGRADPRARADAFRALGRLAGDVAYEGVLEARTLDLMRSVLSPRGARYERIAGLDLGG